MFKIQAEITRHKEAEKYSVNKKDPQMTEMMELLDGYLKTSVIYVLENL